MELRETTPMPESGKAIENEMSTASEAADVRNENEAVAAADELETVGADGENPEAAAEAEMTSGVRQELTMESLLDAAREILSRDAADISNDELRRLKQQFFSLHNSAAAADGEHTEPGVEANAAEITFNDLLNAAREKKNAWSAEQLAVKAANLERKNAIIAEILSLADDTDNVNRTFPRYKELQDEFNAIGEVDQTEETGVWKRFQDAREKFSDNLKINKELRDYDFKKNLEAKQTLLEEARAIADEEDVIAAYRRLQELHNKWRQVGPVAKELREEIWNDFREASVQINKRYQAYFEARKAEEAAHEAAKEALCEKVEAVDISTLKTYSAWDEATAAVIATQKEWSAAGLASPKANRRLFARFRGACDKFFQAKAEFYRNSREELSRNLARKTELAERAEALSQSEDWRATSEVLTALQKEWRTIGAVPKKQSDAVWKRFTTACDTFFARKKEATSGTRNEEAANLRSKREVIGLLSELLEFDGTRDEAFARLRGLQSRWQEIGHVPFREKDKVYEAYRSACDAVRDKFNLQESRRRMNNFRENIQRLEGDDNKLYREREHTLRILEARRNDLRTYENNLGFLSSKSKSGESLVRDLQRRIERLKADIADLEQKIAVIDEGIASAKE
ncbi:MAG: DUF349 domain-containing protein [Muribaculaceae bacterium]|nr:DUF349 domain-containing protein [Muribaculaceae bacterium]